MPSYTIYAETDDYTVLGTSFDSWDVAIAGQGGIAAQLASNTFLRASGFFNGGEYYANQTLLHFNTSAVQGEDTSSALVVSASSINGGGATIEVRERAWSGGGPGNFTVQANLASYPLFAAAASVTAQGSHSFPRTAAGNVPRSASYGLMLHDQRNRTGVAPTSFTVVDFASADAAGTTNDPYLSITTVSSRSFVFGTVIY